MTDAAVLIAVPDEFAQPARWRAFRDPVIEASFRAWLRERTVPIARLTAIASGLAWLTIPVWYSLIFGETPDEFLISAWAIAVPTLLALLLVTHRRLLRWLDEVALIVNIVIGLVFIWAMSSVYGPTSGTVTCGVFATIFYPLIFRSSTGKATITTVTLTVIPVALMVNGIRHGDVSLAVVWPYIAVLLTNAPIMVVSAALIESGTRGQFRAEQTVARQQSQLQVTQRLLRRYAPAAVAARIESGDAEAVGHPQRLRVTAFSTDVAGFTALADRIDPESLSQIINEYVSAMSDVVESQCGVVTEFAGDGLMAIFGAPEPLEPDEQVRRALSAASAMHARLTDLNKTWFRLGIEQPLRVRIGINTGMLSVGTFGSDGRATYTAIGLQMNVAARIQAQCEPGGILLSSASWHLVNDTVECDPLGEVTVKGVHFPISIYAPR